MGSSILAAVAGIDVSLVSTRLTAFATAHQDYSVAHQRVEALEAKVRFEQIRLGELQNATNGMVEDLARLLIADHKPRRNPFASFAIEAPSAVQNMAPGDKAKTVSRLVAAVRLDEKVGAATRTAASVAEEAARQIEVTLLSIDTQLATLRDARQGRDALMPAWDKTLAALRRGARAATDEAPGLYVALFGTLRRSKKVKPAPDADAKTPAAA